ncbi:MAG: hypothetical protein HDT43_11915 [Ruminococcaceae bacterium]|nr:hypothetical protein [Oscillospiraceae bacterium]
MYAVSDKYKEAIAGAGRVFRIRANIYLRDKTVLKVDDSTILGKVMIQSSMMSGGESEDMINIGAANAKKLTMTVLNRHTDLHVFSGARLWLYVSLKLKNGSWEDVPMGKFFINNKSINREKNQVSFTAYDGMILLRYELTDAMRRDLRGMTAWEAAQYLCGGQLVFGQEESDIAEFPNADLPLDFSSEQVETAWDGIMWIAQIMGCFARVNRLGRLEFVQIKSYWKMYTETTGTILAVRNIQGNERYKVRFADDRIHIVGVSMRGADDKLVTQRYEYSHSSDEDPTSDVTIEMPTNPLVMSSDKPLSEILEAILKELSTAYFYSFSAEMVSDPALDAGDTIRLQGGRINGTNHNNDLIGFITHNVWVYRGKQTITNASSVPIVFDGADDEEPAALNGRARARAASTFSARSGEELNFLPPKDQSQKALLGRNDAKRLVGDFGGRYSLEWWNPMGLKAYDYKGDEIMELRIHPDSDQLILSSGTNKVEFVQDNIKIKNDRMGIEMIGDQFYIYDRNGHPLFWLNPDYGAMRFSNARNPSGFEVNINDGTIKMNGRIAFSSS